MGKWGHFFDEGVNALEQDWSKIGHYTGEVYLDGLEAAPAYWLNPPWKNIAPWARKCGEGTDRLIEIPVSHPEIEPCHVFQQGPPIFSLFPAGVGSDWFGNLVLGKCAVYCLNPRITYLDPTTGQPFVSKKTGKPQTGLNDAILCHWGADVEPGVFWWQWKEPAKRARRKLSTKEVETLEQSLAEITSPGTKLINYSKIEIGHAVDGRLTNLLESGTKQDP